jgi:hypothetical protein
MTQDEIIEMARQAGFVDYELDDGTSNAFDKRYKVFANLVAQKTKHRIFKRAEIAAELAIEHALELERESCALVCESHWEKEGAASWCARAIRARGNQ